ncbi:hypothetical protein PVK06_043623 [Gossypium arboreum]|uniref:Putative plant transposon protein domain-containing protein n=1 Tax=Gossypium arboreum TaxID=29729 RepID=A0ABR0MPE9_GOSAR|nr:hypothetical protein PVK06_043623 [Gossypium arboreum]
MPCKRTRASVKIDESQNRFHCEEAKAKYESIFKNQQMHPERGFTLKESNYIDFIVRIRQVWFYFIRFSLMLSSHGTKISLEQMVLLYSILTGKTIDVGKIILREKRNYAVRRSGPAYFPFTITILCLKAKILANVKKTGYTKGTITDWDLYRIARESVLQAQSPRPDLQDELSKLMDIMQHMHWQQQAYWRYSKIRDNSIRSAFTKIYNDPFIFVPEFPDFIFEPWSPLSKEERSDSCKGNYDGAKDKSNLEGSANK